MDTHHFKSLFHQFLLPRALRSFFIFLKPCKFLCLSLSFMLLLSACGQGSDTSSSGAQTTVPVGIRLLFPEDAVGKNQKLFSISTDAIAGIRITVTGDGFEPIIQTKVGVAGEDVPFSLNVRPGPVKIIAEILDKNGRVLFFGFKEIQLSGPVDVDIPIEAPLTIASTASTLKTESTANLSVNLSEAFLSGFPPSIIWEIVGNVDGLKGTITPDQNDETKATYIAPQVVPDGGQALIKASSKDKPKIFETVTLTIILTDKESPLVTAPAPIILATVDASGLFSSNSAIQAFLSAALATDAVDGSLAVIHDAPATFPLGVTTVIFSATDSEGNTGTASSTVTVTDQSSPVVSAPLSIIVAAVNATGTPASNSAIQTFLTGASATDAVDGIIAGITNNAPATFPVGSTLVTFSATDSAGNTGTASSTVTVIDQAAPVVSAPLSIIVATVNATGTPRTNGAIQTFLNAATAIDAIDGAITIITNNAPLTFPIGATTVIFSATDSEGNTGIASSTVTVIDQAAPVVSAPLSIIVAAVNATGTPRTNGVIQAFLNAVTAIDAIDGVITVITNNAPVTFPIGVTTVTFSATDSEGNTGIASSTVTITDQSSPVVSAPLSIIVAAVNATGTPASNSAIQAFLTGASATDAVDGIIAGITNNAPATFPVGSTLVTFSATDSAGNTGTASSTVTITDQSSPVVSAPEAITIAAVNATGTPRTNGVIQAFLNAVTAIDAIDGAITVITNNAPLTFPIGVTTVTFSATDSEGNTGIASSIVTITDQSSPVVTAPVSITVAAVNASGTLRTNGAIQTFLNAATAIDAIDGAITVITNNAPVTFPIGATTVIFSATDSAGNTGTATSTVTITDQALPVVTAPVGITVAAINSTGTPKTNTAIQTFLSGARALDDIDGAITSIINNAPVVFPLGATIVTFSATDSAGNTGTATSTVTITDQALPVVTAPAAIAVAAVDGSGTPGSNGVIQTFLNAARATDNVDGVITLITNNAPTTFPLGTTVVTFSATDSAGNTGTQNQEVTVIDLTSPLVTPPVDITVNATSAFGISVSNIALQVFLSGATATDNVDGTITPVTNNAPVTFPVGITTVTFSAQDANDNFGTATAKVTVLPFDLIPPVVTAPGNISVAAETANGTPSTNTAIQAFLSGATATDNIGVITLTNDAPVAFPIGTTIVNFNAIDAAGNTGTSSATVTVNPLATAVTISAGGHHTCATLSDGRVKCWGRGTEGQLGRPVIAVDSNTPVLVNGITTATSVSAGLAHSCALLSDGSVHCWGMNSSGQLGNGTTTNSKTPVQVSGITTATAISLGENHSCARLSDGSVKCWGLNTSGQLGNGTTTNSTVPVQVNAIASGTRVVSSGSSHSCAVVGSSVKCWGIFPSGFGGALNNSSPVTMEPNLSAIFISTGSGFNCGIFLLGEGGERELLCWGGNVSGQLGVGSFGGVVGPFNGLLDAQGVAFVSTGINHTCGLVPPGNTLKCWGKNSNGQIGNGGTTDKASPELVIGTGGLSATAVSAGFDFTCGLFSGGGVKCWGKNLNGQLGDGTSFDRTLPQDVIGIP